jgi:hypothetical protein
MKINLKVPNETSQTRAKKISKGTTTHEKKSNPMIHPISAANN